MDINGGRMSKCQLRKDLIEEGLNIDVWLIDPNTKEREYADEGERWLKWLFPENEVYYDYLQSDFELNDRGHTLIIAHKGKVFTCHSIDFDFNDQIKEAV